MLESERNYYKVLEDLYEFQSYNVEGYWDAVKPFTVCSKHTICSKTLTIGLDTQKLNKLAENGGVM